MLFQLWFALWKNAFEYPLLHLGDGGKQVARALFMVMVYPVGMALAFVAFVLYPPKIVQKQREHAKAS